MNLPEAINALDPLHDQHWTDDGQPRMDALKEITGDDTLTRRDVTNAAPSFTREVALEAYEAAAAEGAPAAPAVARSVAPVSVQPAAVAPLPPAVAPGEPEPLPPAVEAPSLPGLKPGESVLSLPRRIVKADPMLTTAALAEVLQLRNEANAQMEALKAKIAQLGASNQELSRAAEKHYANRPKGERLNDIQQYLAAQGAGRELKAKRARAFADAGTTAKDVIEALGLTSRIDRALGARRGAGRPVIAPARMNA